MVTTLSINTKVLPGHRIEVTNPALPEGRSVTLTVHIAPGAESGSDAKAPRRGVLLEFIESLPPGPRSAATWEEVERAFQEERNAWDR
ncbi:MAG: hypothetical protein FJX72_16760 [Armatimonadetes bacterium]|nr:hypothetical protein [Armatimonadota bacterium]